MNFIINDFNIYYEKYGSGKENILILPGWGDNRRTFDYLISCFKALFNIYIIDYPGFGKSNFPNKDLTMDDYVNLIIDFMKINNIENPIIIAHSFGGRIAIALSGKMNIKIKKIVLIDSAGIKPKKPFALKLKQSFYKILKKFKYILPKKYKDKYISFLIRLFGSSDFKNLDKNIRKTFINIVNTDLKDYLKYIKSPTLLIWGLDDYDTPIKDAYIMEKEIPDSGLVVLENASHFSYLDYPNYVHTIIAEFLIEK